MACACCNRARPSAGIAGPAIGFIALLVLLLMNAFFFRMRLKNNPRTTGRTKAGRLGYALGSPLMFLPDSSSVRATCSTIWLGDHLPSARGVLQAAAFF